jgi:hypothetical protein
MCELEWSHASKVLVYVGGAVGECRLLPRPMAPWPTAMCLVLEDESKGHVQIYYFIVLGLAHMQGSLLNLTHMVRFL